MKKSYLYAIICVISLVFIIAYFTGKSDPVGKKARKILANPPKIVPFDDEMLKSLPTEEHAGGIKTIKSKELTLEQLVAIMRKAYGHRLNSPKGVLLLLEDLLRHYKDSGDQMLDNIYKALWLAFPDKANELFAKVEKLIKYNEFLRDYNKNVPGMTKNESHEQLWKKRKEFFGEDAAKQIWADELWTYEISESLAKIEAGQAGGKDLPSKLKAYSESINKTLGQQADWYKKNQTINLTQQFLNLGSVQAELSAMDATSRKEALKDVRKEMGLDDQAIKRLDELDQTRDDRWKKGNEYMKERDNLKRQYSGSQLEEELNKARQKHLGNEWEIIKDEEASGYYRFEENRVYGVN